jgi:hypothetical protein
VGPDIVPGIKKYKAPNIALRVKKPTTKIPINLE